MIIVKQVEDLHRLLQQQPAKGAEIGFVPTMGALHKGHISLIKASKSKTGCTVCSIFVNPTQFNDPKDFERYPSAIENDILMLEKNGTDILFLPSVESIYPGGRNNLEHYDIGYLENILEGKYRPGHFQGVCQVMSRLLKAVNPGHLFMGQKDYQQCMVVKKLIELLGMTTCFHSCPTEREADGLAMSSRNLRLNEAERKNAVAIFQALAYLKKNIRENDFNALKARASHILMENHFRIEYVEIADADNLEIKQSFISSCKFIGLIAAYQNETRLIDNMRLTVEQN
ncbi:MAG: pantoate--beta-alanine ligase [Bacteroidetes bacterium]|nr:pantoate--beta-alanine ligase [Bacteroidota bacterium]MBS1974880.1 pantoate--beta-alanine ligase [Bacteroidota bacterium]